jgi:hypothetical protein
MESAGKTLFRLITSTFRGSDPGSGSGEQENAYFLRENLLLHRLVEVQQEPVRVALQHTPQLLWLVRE